MQIGIEMREWLRGVEARWKGYGQCWRCLEWHRDLHEVEFRGWLCKKCREQNT